MDTARLHGEILFSDPLEILVKFTITFDYGQRQFPEMLAAPFCWNVEKSNHMVTISERPEECTMSVLKSVTLSGEQPSTLSFVSFYHSQEFHRCVQFRALHKVQT